MSQGGSLSGSDTRHRCCLDLLPGFSDQDMAGRRGVLSLLRSAVGTGGRMCRCAYSTGPKLPGEDSAMERTALRVLRAPLPGVPGTLMMSTQGRAPLPGVPGTAASAGVAGSAKPTTTPATTAPAPTQPSSLASPASPAQTPATTAPATDAAVAPSAPKATSVQARPSPPPPAPSPSMGAASAVPPDPFKHIPDERRTVKKPSILIPAFGIPILAAWGAYEWYKWQQHDDDMLNVQASIKKMLESAGKGVPQTIASKVPTTRSPPATATGPTPADVKPTTLTSGAAAVPPPPAAQRTSDSTAAPPPEQKAARPEAPQHEGPQALKQAPEANATPSSVSATVLPATTTPAAPAVTQQPIAAAQEGEAGHAQPAAAEGARHEARTGAAEPSSGVGAPLPPPPASTTASVSVAAIQAAVAAAAANVEPQEPVLQHPDEAEMPYMRKGSLGTTLDLSPSGLVRFAIERNRGPGKDWMAYPHHLNQAIADAELMGRAAEQINSWHEAQLSDMRRTHSKEVAGLQDDVHKHQQRAQQAVEQLQASYETFRRLLKQHQEMALELRNLEVQQAEKRVRLQAHQAFEAERKARLTALDEVRLRLSALANAHAARVQQQITSHISHTLSLGVLALDQALAKGLPLQPHLHKLVSHAAVAHATRPEVTAVEGASGAVAEAFQNSEAAAAAAGSSADVAIIKAAAQSVPGGAAKTGIPTLGQLELRLRSMRHTVSALALLPASTESHTSGGILAHALAQFFAWLKVDETSAVKTLGADQAMASGGMDAALAAAELYLSQGHVHDAALVLQQAATGSAAAAAVDAWCADALARASADQALKLLRAHATVMAATVI